MEQTIEFVSGGRPFSALVVEPDSLGEARCPGVLVFHGGAGLGDHERERARMVAELGYVVLAPDLFGERFTSREHGISVITQLVAEPAALRARLKDALSCLSRNANVDATRIAAIGFCFGGLAALELARSGADVRAAISFHGGLTAREPATPNVVKASVLVCTGAADPFVTREHRAAFEDEMTRADVDWQIHVYANAMHGFTERDPAEPGAQRPGSRYDEYADRRSWRAMQSLFAEKLDPTPPRLTATAVR